MVREEAMKKIFKLLLILGVMMAFAISGIRAEANFSDMYYISSENGAYILGKSADGIDTQIGKYSDVSEIINGNSVPQNSKIVFRDVLIAGNLSIKRSDLTFSGSLNFKSGDLIIECETVCFSELSASFAGNFGIRIKKGLLIAENCEILSEGCAVRLDYSADACFEFYSGKIVGSSENGAIFAKYGNVGVFGGKIENKEGPGINSQTSVTIINAPEIIGTSYGIETNTPINLSKKGDNFTGKLSVRYLSRFEQGTISPVCYSATLNNVSNMDFFDINGLKLNLSHFTSSEHTDEKNFLAVYLPYSVTYYIDGIKAHEDLVLKNEPVAVFYPPERNGYKFLAWSIDDGAGEYFEFSRGTDKDVSLYADFELEAPSFSLSSFEFIYDGKEHDLQFNYINHPLINEGDLSYQWYKGEDLISSSPTLRLIGVSNSGEYYCKVKFTHNGHSVSFETPTITVKIHKAELVLPTVEPQYYTGDFLMPSVSGSALYTIDRKGGTDVGSYPVTFTLNDSENYTFANSSDIAVAYFEILKAENYWITEPSVENVYTGASINVLSASRFGTPRFSYSATENGVFTEKAPSAPGVYYLRVFVPGTQNYFELDFGIMRFEIIEERIIGLSVKTRPEKLEYVAFEAVSLDGISILASYNSGKTEEIFKDDIEIIYPSGDCLVFGNKAVTLAYGGLTTSLNVSVSRAEYDISHVDFQNSTLVYNGKYQSPSIKFDMPTGKDGIKLAYEIVGGGVNVGVYEIKLVFVSESQNYSAPGEMKATLKILPFACRVLWENTEFVYDGALKIPAASYINVENKKIQLSVTGGAAYAGRYTAKALCSDTNYLIENSEINYVISKADYDLSGVFWSASEFVYDGDGKVVTVSGLPDGVAVVGYTDNRAENAGEYLAKVLLSYDSLNYNAPKIAEFSWKIKKAEYEISAFSFLDNEVIYDGKTHYPILVGEMPKGKDGSILCYSFDKGAQHVADGKVKVKIGFTSDSKNYNTPEDMFAYVKIMPLGIEVRWENTSSTYSGNSFLPKASSDVCKISVSGSAVNAGRYVATAVSENSDYYVVNSSCDFVIRKANNSWVEELRIANSYEGDSLTPHAVSLGGNVTFRYYFDSELKNEASLPLTHGTYYVVAESDGGENYHSIRSGAFEFTVNPLLAEELFVSVNSVNFKAFQTLSEDDFILSVKYNSSKIDTVSADNVEIKYENGNSFRFGDSCVVFNALGLSVSCSVTVIKADYDLTGVKWTSGNFIYDGEEKNVFITGLPSGVSVLSYDGNGAVNAGQYTVSANFSYDSENYNKPILPQGYISIDKQKLKTPVIAPVIYSAEDLFPVIENVDLYNFSKISYRDSGKYYITLGLKNKENYIFEDNLSDSVVVVFEILPKVIEISIEDIELYRFEEPSEVKYSLNGSIAEGDGQAFEFTFDNGVISCISTNPNYTFVVNTGRIIQLEEFSPSFKRNLFVFILVLLILVLLTLILIFKRDKMRRLICVVSYRKKAKIESILLNTVEENTSEIHGKFEEKLDGGEISADSEFISEDNGEENNQFQDTSNAEQIVNAVFSSAVDAQRADELISNATAKTLLRDPVSVETFGNKRGIVNIDTLNSAFSDGDTVDINKMKGKRLIPYDTAYIKVLARGELDKSLKVYANDFSLSAVKMIALMGGEAIRTHTVKVKLPRNRDE